MRQTQMICALYGHFLPDQRQWTESSPHFPPIHQAGGPRPEQVDSTGDSAACTEIDGTGWTPSTIGSQSVAASTVIRANAV